MEDAFAACHPAVNVIFFAGAIVFGMFLSHPFYLGVSVAASALYYLLLTGKKGVRFLLSMLCFAMLLAFLNPVFQTEGETVLFSYPLPFGIGCGQEGTRRFTLEALLYGAVTGGVFFTMLVWFACYSRVVSDDKFLYLFGQAMPAVSLLLSIVFRLAPELKRKAGQIQGFRRCIGRLPGRVSGRKRLLSGAVILSVLTSWALEGAVTMADSMESRGFGSGRRSVFSIYRFGRRDLAVCLLLFFCAGTVVVAAFLGRAAAGLIGYGLFLFLPSALHIWEDITWSILKSKI